MGSDLIIIGTLSFVIILIVTGIVVILVQGKNIYPDHEAQAQRNAKGKVDDMKVIIVKGPDEV